MTAQTPDFVRWIGYALILGAIVAVGFAIPRFQRARRAPYYGMRRIALRQASNLVLAALAMVILAAVLIFAPAFLRDDDGTTGTPPEETQISGGGEPPALYDTPVAVPTLAPTVTPVLLPTATPYLPPTSVSVVPVPPQPPDAPTSPLATPSPESTLEPSPQPTPEPTSVPAREGAYIELQDLAIEKDEQSKPVNPGNAFPPGDHWVYLFFTYGGMENGVARTFAWYKDGGLLERCSDTGPWQWGDHGRTWYGCGAGGGWEPGSYKIRVLIGDALQGTVEFTILEE